MNTVHEGTDTDVDILRQRIVAVAVTQFANDHGIDAGRLQGNGILTPVEILRARRALGAEVFADDVSSDDNVPTMYQAVLFARSLNIDPVDLLRAVHDLVAGSAPESRTLRRPAEVDEALRELDQ